MGRYPTGPQSCLEDPSCHVYITSITDAGPIFVFCFWAMVVLLCSSFQFYKLCLKKRYPIQPVSFPLRNNFPQARKQKVNSQEVLLDLEDEKEVRITGFRSSAWGEICYIVCCITSLHWIALFIVILFDTYNKCQIGSIDNLCFYGNHVVFGTYDLNSKVFFVVWWLATFWYTTWVIFKGRVHNWFRLPCELETAQWVYVWTNEQEEILSTNVLFLVHQLRRLKAFIIPPEAQGRSEITCILKTEHGQWYFLFEGQRFLIKDDCISPACITVGLTLADFHQGRHGLTSEEAKSRLDFLGFNEIPFKPEPFLYTIFYEMFTLFHVYQLVMYLLQFWNSYLFVAMLMTIIVLLSASFTIYTRRRSQLIIAKLTEYVTEVEVIRDQRCMSIDSRFLVPGDVVKLRGNWLLPCDLLIIQGSCICDESALTGEAMPVQKHFAQCSPVTYHPNASDACHTLFSGTTILQAGNVAGEEVLAVVTATGLRTSKGQLLSAILYPQKMLFKYDEELPIVVLLLIFYALVCFIISIFFQENTGAQSIWVTKWIYCMAIVSQIMSPLLPVALEVGQLHSMERLKDLGIYCLNPRRIAIAGKVRVFCFDKTGTLTKEGLDFIGVQAIVNLRNKVPIFGQLLPPAESGNMHPNVMHGLATCHALTKFGNKMVGNEVEVKMFLSTGWELVEALGDVPVVRSNLGKELKIIKRNEFNHSRSTMSVIVEDDGELIVYCKGSFEKIRDLSLIETLPQDYIHRAQEHALDGCYVLSLGYRHLGSSSTLQDVLTLSRDNVEQDLTFLALVLFRNELKPDTFGAIEALKKGEVRPIMVTGDNAHCAHYIAKQAGMIFQDTEIILGDVNHDNGISWSLMRPKDGSFIRPLTTEDLLSQHMKGLEVGTLELAITGKAFNVLYSTGMMDNILFWTRIFARFTPADKVLVANMHRDHGLIVGMCGDGGNDCGALRAAHVGIALSEAEASVVSPFTSRAKSIASVVDLLREGRGALHTSFACYKFLIIYGLMFSILKLCAYWYGIIPCQMNYFFIDGVAVLSLGYGMTLSYPEDKLGKERPTSSLLGPITVASVMGVWLINLTFLIICVSLMSSQRSYVKWPAKYSHGADWWTLGDNWESTVIFFTMYFQFITSAIVFTFGASFRKSVLINWLLMVSYGSLVILFALLLLLPSSSFTKLWHVASEQFNKEHPTSPVWRAYQQHGGLPSPAMPQKFRLQLWLLICGCIGANILWQKVVVEGPILNALVACFSITPRSRLHV